MENKITDLMRLIHRAEITVRWGLQGTRKIYWVSQPKKPVKKIGRRVINTHDGLPPAGSPEKIAYLAKFYSQQKMNGTEISPFASVS